MIHRSEGFSERGPCWSRGLTEPPDELDKHLPSD